MAEYTIKNIPAEIYQRVQASAENSFRSLNQEILFRLARSLDAEEARLTAIHARWVAEALESGPARPLNLTELDNAVKRGVKRAQSRKAEK